MSGLFFLTGAASAPPWPPPKQNEGLWGPSSFEMKGPVGFLEAGQGSLP